MVWCCVVWCGAVWCGVVWCGAVWCGVLWCDVVRCVVVWCGLMWCGVVWCVVLWCQITHYPFSISKQPPFFPMKFQSPPIFPNLSTSPKPLFSTGSTLWSQKTSKHLPCSCWGRGKNGWRWKKALQAV